MIGDTYVKVNLLMSVKTLKRRRGIWDIERNDNDSIRITDSVSDCATSPVYRIGCHSAIKRLFFSSQNDTTRHILKPPILHLSLDKIKGLSGEVFHFHQKFHLVGHCLKSSRRSYNHKRLILYICLLE